MKKTLMILIALMVTVSAFAQDNTYKGPAKMYVSTFWRQAEMFKNGKGSETTINNMERALASTKEKDPSYSVSEMEEELKKWKAELTKKENAADEEQQKNAAKVSANKEKSREMVKLKNDIHDYFEEPIYSTSMLSVAQKQLDDYKVNVQSIVDRKELLEDLKNDDDYPSLISRLKGYSDVPLNRAINDIVNACENSDGTKGSNWENAFYDMRGLKVHWDAISKSFSEVKEFADAAKKCEELCNKYPTLEKIEAIGKGNRADAIKARKLPPATVKDAKLEQLLMDGFDKKYGPAYRAKAVKAVLTQDGWTTERNEITGIITGRNRTGKIAYKTTEGDGKCYLLANNIFIYEEYIGGTFTNTQVIYNGLGGEEMLCENVK